MPNQTYIDELITDGKKDLIRIENITTSHLISNEDHSHIYRTSFDDFFIQHELEFSQSMQAVKVPIALYYKPKWMSLQLYGTTVLWAALLRANKLKSISDFHWPIISVYSPGKVRQLLAIYFKREGKE